MGLSSTKRRLQRLFDAVLAGDSIGESLTLTEFREAIAEADEVEDVRRALLYVEDDLYPAALELLAEEGTAWNRELVITVLHQGPELLEPLAANAALGGEALEELEAWIADLLGDAYPRPTLTDRHFLRCALPALRTLLERGAVEEHGPAMAALRGSGDDRPARAVVADAIDAVPSEEDVRRTLDAYRAYGA